jgi:uncharacterized damage-inducible protein DinB
MSEPTTALPDSKAPSEDERDVLFGYLDYHRIVLARKAEGLSDQQARLAACPPSDLTILGLIRHMTDVERGWFRVWFVNEDVAPLFEQEAEWQLPPDATIAAALDAYWDEIRVADERIKSAPLEQLGTGEPRPGENTLRRVIVHMIEEYARHCGHADLLRQAIDGVTGD